MVQLLEESSRVESTTGTKQGAGAGALAWPSLTSLSWLNRIRTPSHKRGAGAGEGAGGRDGDIEQNKPTKSYNGKNEVKSVCSSNRAVLVRRGLEGGAQHTGHKRMGTRGRLERGRGWSTEQGWHPGGGWRDQVEAAWSQTAGRDQPWAGALRWLIPPPRASP